MALSVSFCIFPPSIISVPRPAIFVAIVMAFNLPASAIISASCSWCFAFKRLCFKPALFSKLDNISDFSMLAVPIKTGCPFECASFTASTIALNLSFSSLKIKSFKSCRITFLFVGMLTIGSL